MKPQPMTPKEATQFFAEKYAIDKEKDHAQVLKKGRITEKRKWREQSKEESKIISAMWNTKVLLISFIIILVLSCIVDVIISKPTSSYNAPTKSTNPMKQPGATGYDWLYASDKERNEVAPIGSELRKGLDAFYGTYDRRHYK